MDALFVGDLGKRIGRNIVNSIVTGYAERLEFCARALKERTLLKIREKYASQNVHVTFSGFLPLNQLRSRVNLFHEVYITPYPI